MSAKNKKKTKSFHLLGALSLWSAIFAMTIIIAVSGNLSINHLLIATAITTVFFLLVGGLKQPVFIGSSFIFLPAIVYFSRGFETLQINSPAWHYQLGGLLISLWLCGLIYIIVASLIRFIGIKKMRRVFSPIFKSAVVALLAITLIPRIYLFSFKEPLISSPEHLGKYIVISSVSFLTFIIFTSLNKKSSKSLATSLIFSLMIGVIFTLLVDASEILLFSHDIEQTLLFKYTNSSYWQGDITIFENFNEQFSFWHYLHFDLESFLIFLPFIFLSIAEHIQTLTRYSLKQEQPENIPHADRTVLSEGMTIMVGGMIAGYPLRISDDMLQLSENYSNTNKWSLIAFSGLLLVIGLFVPVAKFINIIPLPVIGGTLVGWASFTAVKEFSHISKLVHNDLNPQAVGLTIIVFGFGFILQTLEFVADYTGDYSLLIHINQTPIPSFIFIIFAAFLLNLIFPKILE